ncbi:DUF262 domain-containing HNH endonuclease family protein [Pseudanabaena galeata UHCC 0370]|uniref:DUF262 domain-containing HNH endonuclease family protein n=1 Tax=Pseudanabaena galeata UHCC 0370 TaxID=3110310 RepID=A0ABU5TGH2_9CYAN|nr:DUF262 domain-containing HNH endonuclease family protein [Pseudanabaena galeata]MEA5476743.1 DUF262 domain-containing HNH endonuclease family protein [Pseudanabaena galeata UHCC 0370]
MSVMNFNTANQTFRQLLGNGLLYRVPPFQRDYSWTEEEWDDLWQDILGLFAEDGEQAHYMGYLVLQSSNNKQFDIIDGQQRLTTISILILAALAHLQNLVNKAIDPDKNQRRKDNLQNSYIGYVDPVSLIPRSKLELNRHNNRFYQTYLVPLEPIPVRGLNASEHQLRKAFNWFRDKIAARSQQSGEAVAIFVDTIVDKLFFTAISVTDELNAFKVFETLNSRGVRLSATDLLKNYLFSVIASGNIHEIELKALEERWERIVDELGSESFPDFLRVYWNSCHKLVRKADLFKTIRRHVTTKEQSFALLRELDRSASIYAALRNPYDSIWKLEEKRSLEQLLMFNVRQPMPMLMSAHRQFAETQRQIFTQLLQAIAVISFRYNVICNLQTQDQEQVYNNVAYKIDSGALTNLRSILDELQSVYPDDAVFKAAFTDKELKTTNSRNKKVVRYILFQLEKQVSGQEFEFESPAYNLEHILPENPAEAWSHIDEQNQDKFVYRLGNMTPLEKKPNRAIGNQGYADKIAIFQESCFKITSDIPKNSESWTEKAITTRQAQLAKIATAIWKVDMLKAN